MEKILVCGNGPSLKRQLFDLKCLDDFNLVVRINKWEEIEDYDNRCDAWIFYPLHDLSFKNEHPKEYHYDFKPYIEKTKETWLAHSWAYQNAKEVLGEYPTYTLTIEQFAKIMNDAGHYAPTTGVFAIHMAMLRSTDVWIAGFDFYQNGIYHYFYDSIDDMEKIKNDGKKVHNYLKDKKTVDKFIEEGKVKVV